MGAGDAAYSGRRIARARHGAARLVGVLHERKEKRRRSGIHRALDHHHVVPRRPDDCLRRSSGDRPEQADHLGHVDRHVLHVDDEKIEAGATERFGGRRRSAHEPRAHRRLPGRDGALEEVRGKIHGAPRSIRRLNFWCGH